MQFYVYEWFNIDTNEIFYVGKGCKTRHKQVRKRNKLFMDYYNTHQCRSRIVKWFETEQEAFQFEYKRIIELKSISQCSCNLDNGGKGGYHFVWTNEMREYKSQYNPMKNQYQRERMKKNNPMKNPETVKKVKEKISKKIVLGEKLYNSIKELANEYNVRDTAISYWLKRGYGANHQPCYYYGNKPKEFVIRTHETSNKPVIIDDIYFRNVKAGAEYIGVWSESLIRAINGKRECKGHKCKYANQQPSHTNTDKSSVEGSTTNG